MRLSPREQMAIAQCLQQMAAAITVNPESSFSTGYQQGMEQAGYEPLAVHELRDLAEQIFIGDRPSTLNSEDYADLQSLVAEMGGICKGMVLRNQSK